MEHTYLDRTPYTYLIKHIKSGKVYYGCKYAKNCHPSTFWVDYFTSSKRIKDIIAQEGKDSFIFEIRKVFDSTKKCLDWEKRVLKRMNAIYRNDFFNENVGGTTRIKSGEENPMYGKSRPEISDKMKKNNPMHNHRSLMKSVETKKSKRKLGLHKSTANKQETIEKTAKRMSIDNPMNNQDSMNKAIETKKAKGIYSKQHKCPHCDAIGAGPNIYRFHFKNCKNYIQDSHSDFDPVTPALLYT